MIIKIIKMLVFHCYNSKKAILQHEFPDKCECGFGYFLNVQFILGF